MLYFLPILMYRFLPLFFTDNNNTFLSTDLCFPRSSIVPLIDLLLENVFRGS